MSRLVGPVALGLLAASCAGWCGRGPDVASTSMSALPIQAYLRVDLSLVSPGNSVRVDGVTRVETSGIVTAGGGDHFVAAYAGDTVQSAVSFAFPVVGLQETFGVDGRASGSTEIRVANPRHSVFVRDDPSLTRLDVLRADGTRLAAIDPARVRTSALADWLVRPLHAAETMIDHIRIMTPLDDMTALQGANDGDATIVDTFFPDEDQVAQLRVAVDALTPVLRGAVASLTVVEFSDHYETDEPTVKARVIGNHVFVSTLALGDQDYLNEVIAHEAVHAFQAIVDQESFVNTTTLPGEVVSAAQTARGRLRNTTITSVLERLQTTATLADPRYRYYVGEAWATAYTTRPPHADGLMSMYGGRTAHEDLAELVSWVVIGRAFSQPFCTDFEGLDKAIPRDRVLGFAKLNLARGLRLISEDDYKACVHDADPADDDGIFLDPLEFTSELTTGAQPAKDTKRAEFWEMFRIRGQSETGRLEIRLRMRQQHEPNVSPIGFYELDRYGAQGMAADALREIDVQNVILYQPKNASNDTDLAARTRISGGGFALITDANSDFAKGYLFYVPFHNIIDFGARKPTGIRELVWFRITADQ